MKEGKCFWLNHRIFQEECYIALEKEFGWVACIGLIQLLCRIYKQGSEIKYDGHLIQSVSNAMEVPCATITTFVEKAVESGLFVRSKFEKGILRPSAEIAKAG